MSSASSRIWASARSGTSDCSTRQYTGPRSACSMTTPTAASTTRLRSCWNRLSATTPSSTGTSGSAGWPRWCSTDSTRSLSKPPTMTPTIWSSRWPAAPVPTSGRQKSSRNGTSPPRQSRVVERTPGRGATRRGVFGVAALDGGDAGGLHVVGGVEIGFTDGQVEHRDTLGAQLPGASRRNGAGGRMDPAHPGGFSGHRHGFRLLVFLEPKGAEPDRTKTKMACPHTLRLWIRRPGRLITSGWFHSVRTVGGIVGGRSGERVIGSSARH
ncbi:protein of unknown function [Micropruina glycogenica]|uniref:Uncharacterized protein n=1 Tax=Micropruina glycogenica TaxID=75385 RepID=A0A2N9JGM7_9ACTN|nr:protein of unknown function [Micropruina glycogenica]